MPRQAASEACQRKREPRILTSYPVSRKAKNLLTLKQQLEESSQSEAEEFVKVQDPEKVQRKVITAFRRMFLRLTFVVTSSRMQRVERYWEAKTLGLTSPREERYQPKQKPQNTKRRDDLTGVGEPIPPTQKVYPICRTSCTHEDTTGQTYLQAQGGQKRCPTLKMNVPMYLWVCRACGARWERIPVGSSSHQEAPKQTTSSALQPTKVTKTEEKRKALEVAIHSGEDADKTMLVDGVEGPPRQG